jgi:signal transduction histidine kinase/CheY-like chemotaxis protein
LIKRPFEGKKEFMSLLQRVSIGVLLVASTFVISAVDLVEGISIGADIDSFIEEQKSSLEVAQTDEQKAKYTNNIGYALSLEGKYKEAAVYHNKALAFNTNKCSRNAIVSRGSLFYLESLRTGSQAKRNEMVESLYCARELKDKNVEAHLHLLEGKVYRFTGNYSKAFNSLFKAKELKELDGEKSDLAEVYIEIAGALADINQPAQAKVFLQQALSIGNRYDMPHQLSRIYSLLSNIYLQQKNANYAKAYATKALQQAKRANSTFNEIQAYLALTDLFLYLSDYDLAKEYLLKADNTLSANQAIGLEESVSRRKARLQLGLGKEGEALRIAEETINRKNAYTSVHDVLLAYETEVRVYNSKNDYKSAFERNDKLNELKNKLGINGAFQQYLILKKKSEQIVKDTKNIKQKAETELEYQAQRTADIIKYSSAFVVLLLLVILFILYRQVHQKQRTNEELEERNNLINKQNLELRKMNAVLDEARIQAEAGSIAKSNFLAVTSHEIRTPMNGIMGMASLLLESPLNEEQTKYVETIQTSSENLLTILNDILDFSKIEAGKMNIESTLIDLNRLLDEVIIIFSKQAKDKNIELKKFIGNAMISQFRGDILRIRQVLINLVSNAIKFTENGSVTILVEIEELLRAQTDDSRIAKLKFSVKDDGIGISAEKQKKIFESFEQEDGSTSRKYGGIGLGLSISKKLVELMGGEIGLVSEKNVGTTFYFTLNVEIPKKLSNRETPVNHKEVKEQSTTPMEGKLSENHPLKILVAEDNPFNKLFIDKLFEKFGYTDSLHAENGIEVLSKLEENEVDIILMDIQMPEMDGLEATQKIIEKYGENRPTIIALTADANESSKEEYLSEGMDGFLSKPFKAEDLRDMLIEHSNRLRKKEKVG